MLPPEELLARNKIKIGSTKPGRYYTLCPQCSAGRSKAHRTLECLGVTIDDAGSVRWGCNHCGWTGPEKGSASGNGHAGADDFAAVYDYADANGGVKFQKVRNWPGRKNKFFMRRSDGNGGWINGTKGIDTSLIYRLPEIMEAIALGHVIAVAEGEKDVDNLWRIGIPATCNAHGASEPGKKPKWTKKHSEQLRGADLIILNDNDAPGRDHPEFRREVQRLSALNLLDFPFPGAAFASPKSSGRRRRRKENLAFPW